MPDFSIGLSEILVLGIIAVIIFGPERLPDVAKKAGRVLRYLRGIANDAKEYVRDEFGDDVADFDPRALKPKNLARSVLGADAVGDLDATWGKTRDVVNELNAVERDLKGKLADDGQGGPQALGVKADQEIPGDGFSPCEAEPASQPRPIPSPLGVFTGLDEMEELEKITHFGIDLQAT
ncbi:MAG: twin-arginine translocase TatA/TatE family subunit [Propionibacteriaceae bacterium]|jgi:sec-independent protein translocase protein TatB|nr:twin-arginine translocase TatA/TatE family subunit [Propionibacteriaceae bacterium]